MTHDNQPQRTPLANWLHGYIDEAGNDVTKALQNLAHDLGIPPANRFEESSNPDSAADVAVSENPARDSDLLSDHSQRAHGRQRPGNTGIAGSALDTDTSAGGSDE